MEMNRAAINATGDGEFKRNRLCGLLDELMVMHWDLSKNLRDNPDLPATLTARLWQVSAELDVTINTLKTLVREQELPL